MKLLRICDGCKDRKERCHLSCDKFKSQMQIESERRALIKQERKKEKEKDEAQWKVHQNGLKYERNRKKAIYRANIGNA